MMVSLIFKFFSNTNYNYNIEGTYDVKLSIETIDGCKDNLIVNNIIKRGVAPTVSFNLVQSDSCINTIVYSEYFNF